MALPPLQDLLDLLDDNINGDISADDMQSIVTDLYNGILTGGGGGGGGIPVGGVIPWATDDIPLNFVECDGTPYDPIAQVELFNVLGVTYGGDGISTFNVPDYRGKFLRPVDGGAGNDPDASARTDRGDGTVGDNVGTNQDGEFLTHTHSDGNTIIGINNSASTGVSFGFGGGNSARQLASEGGDETRPINIYVRFVMRIRADVSSSVGADITPSTGSQAYAVQAHDLGVVPIRVQVFAKCLIADLSYTGGDEVPVVVGNGISIVSDGVNTQVLQNTDLQLYEKATQALTTVTYASWALVVKAGI